MKGKIDKYGCLQIERAGDWIPCGCRPGGIMPHDNDYGTCDHSCPHFGEPEEEWFDGGLEKDLISCGRFKLRLCRGTVLVFDEFTDERSAT